MFTEISSSIALRRWRHTAEDLDLLHEILAQPAGRHVHAGGDCRLCGGSTFLVDFDLSFDCAHIVVARVPFAWCMRCRQFAELLRIPHPASAIAAVARQPLAYSPTGAFSRSSSSAMLNAKPLQADFYVETSHRLIASRCGTSYGLLPSLQADAHVAAQIDERVRAAAQMKELPPDWSMSLSAYYGVFDHPRVLKIEPSQFCNLRCTFCPNPDLPSRKHLKLARFQEFWSRVDPDEVVKVGFTGLGESLLNNDFWEMHRIVKQHGIYTSLVTNGMLLDRKADHLAASGIDSIAVSLESLNADDHARQRVGSDLSRVLTGIELLARKCRGTVTGVHVICAMKPGATDDAIEVIMYCHGLGLPPPKVYPLYERFSPDAAGTVQSLDRMRRSMEAVREAVTKVYGTAGIRSREEFLLDVALGGDSTYADLSCKEPRQVFVYRSDASYAACNESIFDLQDLEEKRDAQRLPIHTLWQSSYFKRKRLSLYFGKPFGTCRDCNAFRIPNAA